MHDIEIPAIADRPSHVPEALVYDVDLFNLDGAKDDVHQAWKRIQRDAPRIFWTPRNGGLWMVTRAEDILETQKDPERFSTKGLLVPNVPRPYPAPPLDIEPPEHAAWRMLVSPAFSPKVVAEVEDMVRRFAADLIDEMAPKGECEFVSEFTKVLPIVVFLTMMQLPLEEREELLPHADVIASSPDPVALREARLNLRAYIVRAVEERKINPRDDLITKIMHAQINGEPAPEDYVIGMCTLLLSGGLDTVKNMLGFCAKFLAQNPGHVRWLRENPDKLDHATEELIRRHGVSNTAKLVVKDCELAGVQLKAGDQIQGVNCLVGLDDDTVDDPMTVNFERPAPIPHAAFGNGPHRCPGSILARREIKVWLEEWLPRIPEFGLKPGTKPVQDAGMVNSVSELWLSWDPAVAQRSTDGKPS